MPHKDPEAKRRYMSAYGRAYYQRHKERLAALRRARRSRDQAAAQLLRTPKIERTAEQKKAAAAKTKRRTKYGHGADAHYEQQKKKQNNCCAICGASRDKFLRELALDHNHSSGQWRGLLCPPCNTALAALENTSWRMRAEEYLENWRGIRGT